jgi:hypothetical protein
MPLEIDECDFNRRAIVVLQRIPKVVEAAAESALRGQERVEPARHRSS